MLGRTDLGYKNYFKFTLVQILKLNVKKFRISCLSFIFIQKLNIQSQL